MNLWIITPNGWNSFEFNANADGAFFQEPSEESEDEDDEDDDDDSEFDDDEVP